MSTKIKLNYVLPALVAGAGLLWLGNQASDSSWTELLNTPTGTARISFEQPATPASGEGTSGVVDIDYFQQTKSSRL